jgi:hypothetical protein
MGGLLGRLGGPDAHQADPRQPVGTQLGQPECHQDQAGCAGGSQSVACRAAEDGIQCGLLPSWSGESDE